MEIKYPNGATPLDPNEIDGLLLTHVTTQNELNRWEQQNILKYIQNTMYQTSVRIRL